MLLLYGSLHTVKKLFAIAFTCVYLLLSVGVVKTTHYCMGRESSSTLFSFEAKKCPCSQYFTEKNSCCSDEHEIVRIKDEQNPGSSHSFNIPDYFEICSLYTEQLLAFTSLQGDVSQATDGLNLPPPKPPLYTLHCSLVFYEDELVV